MVSLDLDGEGKAEIQCEEKFLEHMLRTLFRYAGFDAEVRAGGDDQHHLVEDVAITLGKALRQAMGDAPVERMASALVPMDDALVEVALDLVDRPYADIDCPDQLYHHFLRSLAMSSGMTLHTEVRRGFDAHHIVEAEFKALGLALRRALVPRASELSTKERERLRSG
jgi:imidazoleglycerol-phosphate dehydratase